MFKEQYGKLVARFGKRNVTIGAVIIGVIVLGLVANGVGRRAGDDAAERAIEAATGGKVHVDSNGNEVTVKTDQGTWTTANKLPDDFPSDVPVYAGAKVTGSVAAAGTAAGSHYVGLETTDALATVIAWYRSEVKAKGWTVVTDATVNGGLILSATKDSRALSVTVTGEEGKVVIGLAVANQ
jgi:hypothetical protein